MRSKGHVNKGQKEIMGFLQRGRVRRGLNGGEDQNTCDMKVEGGILGWEGLSKDEGTKPSILKVH